jgi:hypothetical protein
MHTTETATLSPRSQESRLNWSDGCHDELYGYLELLKRYTRSTEPYQNGPATEELSTATRRSNLGENPN